MPSPLRYYSVPGIGDTWGVKERTDEGGARLNGREVRRDAATEGFVAPQRSLADALALEGVPDELVGVQLEGVARQEVELEATGETLDIRRDDRGAVRGVAVEDEEHEARAAAQEVPQQFDEARGVEALRVDLVPEGAAGVHGGDGAHALAPPTRGDLGRLPPQAPRPPKPLVGAHPGFVEEEDLRAHARGPGAQAREYRHLPGRDRRGIPLVGAPQGFLGRDVQLGEEAPDRRHARPHAELLRDQRRHNLARPQAKIEAVLARGLAIDPAPDLELLARRPGWRPARMFPRRQGRLAPAPLGRQPLVDRRPTQPVPLDDRTRGLALLHPPDRQPADRFRGLMRQRPPVNAHAPSYHD